MSIAVERRRPSESASVLLPLPATTDHSGINSTLENNVIDIQCITYIPVGPTQPTFTITQAANKRS